MVIISKFYKVLVLSIDIFESSIVNEKHFKTYSEASEFCSSLKDSGLTTMIVEM